MKNEHLTREGYKMLLLRFTVQIYENNGYPDALVKKVDRFLAHADEKGERELIIGMVNKAADHQVLYWKIMTANSVDFGDAAMNERAKQGGQDGKVN